MQPNNQRKCDICDICWELTIPFTIMQFINVALNSCKEIWNVV